ncbi:hypothetical protein GLOTRDRAFT_140479 [Gloeophyllum trabeum ATCC 11539]|uniref:BTB domain-containing protein n=1 Tax=Gloeophyllum trabeum (strain ATCC 11539 / FP-39264 / Madison 617) TaxID=670483 RepID=S7RCT1_GLOTA|nr:uncharacterized protein GLOTRDRAFT_140479 [Gloeophyllum trabeum ATCC 11539]EPQ52000.1 hypothetical protein GLOTRDRAFT_140479 [Gloeophyllum trabeum ATCC 11539]
MAPPVPAPPPPSLQEATKHATQAWQDDLQSLFNNAKDRFPDVVWELYAEEDDKEKSGEEVWGHKAIVYARAPPSFQARYFSFRPAPVASPTPYSASPGTLAGQSSLSLGLDLTPSRSPSPFRVPSPSPSGTANTLLRIPTFINPILFSNELEYLYTGKGLGEAFEFLFDSTDSREDADTEESRIDKLRKDLVFMWRSRLYSDVRITLEGNFSSSNHESATAIFSSHRFILVSRSPYFRTRLLTWPGAVTKASEPLTLNLPSPPFTPASLFFTLGFMYAGTLVFSHRTYDLDTAFHIMRSATYLSLDSLYNEIQARIVQEMMHGLFHAFLEFSEYERITGGKWGIGGCRCRQCARRAPRVLEFATADDVKNPHLDRGARRALVGLFGEGWVTPEFTKLPQKTRESLLKGLAKRTNPPNVFALLFAAQHAIEKLKTIIDAWADISRDMVLSARKVMDEVLCNQAEECFEQPEWLELMEADGVRFEDGERVGIVMDSVLRGLNEKNAGLVYQTLVSSILLRPHATETDQTMLSSTSHVRVQVEETRVEVLKWLRKRWLGVRQEGGFDNLEGWALKEISHEIEVPHEDLMNTAPTSTRGPVTRTGLRSTLRAETETDTVSMHSMRTSIAQRNLAKSPVGREPLASSASSVRSTTRSTMSSSSRVTTSRPLRVRNFVPSGPRPDSKLTPDSSIAADDRSSMAESETTETSSTPPKPTIPRRSGASSSSMTQDTTRPKSVAASVKTVRSKASTVRKVPVPSTSSLRPPSSLSRPNSTLSTTSDSSTTFKTAPSDITSRAASSRARRPSVASTVSTTSVRTTPRTPVSVSAKVTRSRRPSVSSTTSAISTTARKRPSVSPLDTKPGPAKRAPSMASVHSTASTSTTGRKTPARKPGARDETPSRTDTPPTPAKPVPASAASTIKGKSTARTVHDKTNSVVSTSSVSTLRRKGSSDTIKENGVKEIAGKENGKRLHESELATPQLQEPLAFSPRGATLDIGIPCIISSKRARFKAFARYIGEVEGESGPWVGVEVPVDDTWPDEKLEGRQWNDGSWGGVRYFQLGTGSEFDYGDGRAVRRRRFDWATVKDRGLKREGDTLSVDRVKRLRSASPTASDVSTSESRGLFVRPQQVLYVVDAVA